MLLKSGCRYFGHLLIMVTLGYTLSACTSEDVFIQQVQGREGGLLCYPSDEWNKPSSSFKCYHHKLEPPYLVLDWHHDELWSPWPDVTSLSGHSYPYSDFTDSIIGYAIQDLCEDSVRLTYHSVFRDTVSLVNAVYPNSVLKPNYAFLGKLADYVVVKDIAAFDLKESDSLQVFLFEAGCFHHTSDLFEVYLTPRGGTIIAFGEYDFQRDSTYSLSSDEVNQLVVAIEEGVSSCSNCGSTTYSSVYLKNGNRLLNLTNEENAIGKLISFLSAFEPVYIPRSER